MGELWSLFGLHLPTQLHYIIPVYGEGYNCLEPSVIVAAGWEGVYVESTSLVVVCGNYLYVCFHVSGLVVVCTWRGIYIAATAA